MASVILENFPPFQRERIRQGTGAVGENGISVLAWVREKK